jgi:dTDP-4-amino-4,6-dideoxygalactose transaminase
MVKHSFPFVGREEVEEIKKIIKNGILSSGKIVEKFEKKVLKFVGTRFSVAVNSGSAALFLILKFLPKVFPDLSGKRKVVIPSFACPAISNAVLFAGYEPVFSDINLDTFALDFDDVKKKIGPDTLGIVYIHSFGICNDLKDFVSLGVPVIEGIAQSFGGKVSGRFVGSYGVASFSSFYATKVITTAEGGAIFSDEKKLIDKIKDFIDYDKKDYEPDQFRFNFKMSDVQAAIGLAQLKKISYVLKRRKELGLYYIKKLHELGRFLKLPPKVNNIFFRFVVIADGSINSENVIDFMRKKGIMADKPIWKPLHYFYGASSDLENTEFAYEHGISLPIHLSITKKQIDLISHILSKAMQMQVGKTLSKSF